MRRCDVDFTPHGMELQIIDFKMALRTGRERLAFTVPIDWDEENDHIVARLLRLVVERRDAAGRHPHAMHFVDPSTPLPSRRYWLAARITSSWVHRVMQALSIAVPIGGRYQGHSLRAVAGSEAYAIGVPAPMIAEVMGHASVKTTQRSYVKTRLRASPAAWEVFGRYAPSAFLQLKWRFCPLTSGNDLRRFIL